MLQVCKDVPREVCSEKQECKDVTHQICKKVPYKNCYVIYNKDACKDDHTGKKVTAKKGSFGGSLCGRV